MSKQEVVRCEMGCSVLTIKCCLLGLAGSQTVKETCSMDFVSRRGDVNGSGWSLLKDCQLASYCIMRYTIQLPDSYQALTDVFLLEILGGVLLNS